MDSFTHIYYPFFYSCGRQRTVAAERPQELLTKRHEAALQLGFSCHAERMLALKMAGSLDDVDGGMGLVATDIFLKVLFLFIISLGCGDKDDSLRGHSHDWMI